MMWCQETSGLGLISCGGRGRQVHNHLGVPWWSVCLCQGNSAEKICYTFSNWALGAPDRKQGLGGLSIEATPVI